MLQNDEHHYKKQVNNYYGKKNTISKDIKKTGFINFPKLEKAIREYHKDNEHEFLTTSSTGKAMQLMKLPSVWGNPKFENIRHAYITRAYEQQMAISLEGQTMYRERLATLMFHSVSTAQTIYFKFNDKNIRDKDDIDNKEKNQKLTDKQLVIGLDTHQKKTKTTDKNYKDDDFNKQNEKDKNYSARLKSLINQYNYTRPELESIVSQYYIE